MRDRGEDIALANRIIQEECIPELRRQFLYMKMVPEVFGAVLTVCRGILQEHESRGELSLEGIDVNVRPGISGHLSVWASEANEEAGGYVN